MMNHADFGKNQENDVIKFLLMSLTQKQTK